MDAPHRQSLEGLVVLGMHRSGTSLVTRLVSMLGLSLCRTDDLMLGIRANPRGHWESRSMMNFNDRLLYERGGAWFCPPLLGPPEIATMVATHGDEARRALAQSHPVRPFVWKDPRTAVLAPFWATVQEGRVAYLLVMRHPLEVSDSLRRRDRFDPALGLALWERYTRQSLIGAAGHPLLTCTYDAVLADPTGWLAGVGEFLRALGMPVGEETPSVRHAVDAFVSADLRHGQRSWEGIERDPLLTGEQTALAAAVRSGAHASFLAPELPRESPSTEAVFAEIRPRVREQGVPRLLPTSIPPRLRTEPHAEPSRPAASLVHLGPTPPCPDLIRGLPDGSELIVVETTSAGAGPDAEPRGAGLIVRSLRREDGWSEAAAIASGLDAAEGRVVLVSTGHVLRCGSWYPELGAALERWQVAGVSPVLRFCSGRDSRHLGRAYTTPSLVSETVRRDGGETVPGEDRERLVPVPLLAAELVAFDRGVVAAAGGVDRGFSSARAAVEELSIRLWRMGFRCCAVPSVEAWAEQAAQPDEAGEAHALRDRRRTAILHFPADRAAVARLEAGHPSLAAESPAEREELESRRIEIEALCALPIDDFVGDFTAPLRRRTSARRNAAEPARRPPAASPLRRIRRLFRAPSRGRRTSL